MVGGYLPGDGGRSSTFGSVLMGLYEPCGGSLRSGRGSPSRLSLRAFDQTLTQIERESSPFSNEVLLAGGRPVWVEPAIVVNVEYKEWTHDDHLRARTTKAWSWPEAITWDLEGPGAG